MQPHSTPSCGVPSAWHTGSLVAVHHSRSVGLLFKHSLRRSLDVSQWMLNGDYAPTRIDAQYDAGK